MALDFPTSPSLNEIYTYGGRSWQWNGTAWDVYNASGGLTAYVSSFNGLTGAVTGVTTGTANTFVALQSFTSGISASGGVTLAGTLQGTTANFTGLVSSTVGFSGAATNLTGNASGLTAGSASKVQIAQASASSYYFALASGIGNTGLYVDTNTPQWSYFPSSGLLSTSSGAVSADYFEATGVGVYSNNYYAYDPNSVLVINTPNFDGTSQGIIIGDYNGSGNGTTISLDDANTKIEIGATNVDCFANMNVKGGSDLRFYVPGGFTYIGFKSPLTPPNNIIWTLPSADGSSNQVLTTNGSGTLSWSTPSGGSSVTSFNGLTGAVTGVSRVNGFTGGITFAAGTGITFTASAGTITLSTTGGGGSKTYAVYTPLDNQPPAANYATINTRNSIMVLEFDAATDESAVFVGVMPEAASLGSGLKIRINWMATSATSGTCRWGVQIERMNTDEDSDSFDTAATAGSTTNGTSGIITTTEITITTIDSVTAGDPFRIKVYRDADGTSGTDDMTGDAQLVSVEVRSAS
jgi:hypothetical protein